MDYIVGITEQELEFFYNKSTGLSGWSELDEMDRMQVILNTAAFIRDMMHKAARREAGDIAMAQLGRWTRLEVRKNYGVAAMHAAKQREKSSSDS
tara:strand:- start:100 stop:384 length:285 start_codon:yes stop_codon:yes gene_type:complete